MTSEREMSAENIAAIQSVNPDYAELLRQFGYLHGPISAKAINDMMNAARRAAWTAKDQAG